MRAGGRILMIFGLVLGIIAAAATFIILTSSPSTAAEPTSTLPSQSVVVAVQSIEPWQEIPAGALQVRDYPDPVPVDAVLADVQVDELDETGAPLTVGGTEFVTGKISNSRIYPGQVIVTSQLVDKELEEQRLGLGSDASYIIPDGQVAIAIPVDSVSTIAGALQSGDRVDIMGTVDVENFLDPEGEDIQITQTFLQNIEILRVGPWVVAEDGGQDTGTNVVTVIVEPQQALEVMHIREKARWQFVLRSITDEVDYVTEPVTDEYLDEQYNIIP